MEEQTINSIKALTRSYYDYQRERIQLDGRLGIKKDGSEKKLIPPKDPSILAELYKRRDEVFAVEQVLEKELKKEVQKYPLWEVFLSHVKGCGPDMTAVIISEIDIHKAEAVSNIWSFAGLAPGKDKKKKGEKCPFNQFLKAKLEGVLGSCFLKADSPYRAFYDNYRHRKESEDWGTSSKNPTNKDNPKAGHQHRAAIRYMVKMFLKDLYVAWRALENLPIRKPYQEEYLKKSHQKRETQGGRASQGRRENHGNRASHASRETHTR